ncbi:MAG: hypothetical protein QW505_03335, partial [Thermoplasmata archaeon]
SIIAFVDAAPVKISLGYRFGVPMKSTGTPFTAALSRPIPEVSTAIKEPEMRDSAIVIPIRAYSDRFLLRRTDPIE